MPVTVPCSRCGGPMDLSPDLEKLAAGQPISLQHAEGKCPGQEEGAPPPPPRRWRCETRVYELLEESCGDEGCDGKHEHAELFAAFGTEAEAPTLQVALPKLADGIGKQWAQAVEHAPFADQPVVPDEGPVVEESPEPERPVETLRLPEPDGGAASSAPSSGPGHDPAPPSAPEKRLAREWQEQYGRVIVDPDGWRMPNAPDAETPISYDEFVHRAGASTTAPYDTHRDQAHSAFRVA